METLGACRMGIVGDGRQGQLEIGQSLGYGIQRGSPSQPLPSGFVPGAPPCCCSTPAAMELGQNLWVGRCWDLIFLALGAGSGLLASSMGCRMRLRALMNLPGLGFLVSNSHWGRACHGVCVTACDPMTVNVRLWDCV